MVKKRLIYTIFVLSLFYALVFSQTGPVTFHFQDKTLREALREISEKTGVQFIYSDALVEGKIVNGTLSESSVDRVLYDILPGSDIAFKKIVSGKIVLYAADKQYIKGFVYDGENGEALPYANILLEGTRLGTAASESGFFALANPEAPPCTLSVSYIGYTPKKIADVSGGSENVNVGLDKSPIETQEIIVSADREPPFASGKLPGMVQMYPERIKSLPTTGAKEIHRSMQLMPGISAVHEKPEGLYVLGGTPDQNLVLLDGIPVYKSTHFFGLVSAFHPDAIDSVNMYLGGYPAQYGGHLSGMMDYKVQSGLGKPLSFGASVDVLEGNDYIRTPLNSRTGLFIAVRSAYNNIVMSNPYRNLYSFLTQLKSFTTFPKYNYYDITSKLDYQIGQNEFLSVVGYSSVDFVDRRNTFGSYYSIVDKNEWENTGVSILWKKKWNARNTTKVSTVYSKFYQVYEKNDPYPYVYSIDIGRENYFDENQIKNVMVKMDNRWKLNPAHHIGYGAHFQQIKLYNQHEKFYEYVTSTQLPDLWVGNVRNEFNNVLYSGYVQDDWTILQSFYCNTGLYVTKLSDKDKFYLQPRISLSYSKNNFHVSAAWGRYYQYLQAFYNSNYYQGFAAFWDFSPTPASSEQNLLELRYNPGPIELGAKGYIKNYSGLNNLITVGDQYKNGSGSAKGVIFTLQKPSGRFTGWASYHWSRVNYTVPGFNDGYSFPANYHREHEFKFILQYKHRSLELSLAGIHASGRPYTPALNRYSIELLDKNQQTTYILDRYNSGRMNSYNRLDVRFSRKQIIKAKTTLEVGIAILNLFKSTNFWQDDNEYFENYYSFRQPDKSYLMMEILPVFFIRLQFNQEN